MSGYPSPIYNSPTIASGGTLVFESGSTLDVMPGAVVIGGTVQHVRVTLTSAQILAIAATPITVIPAPGAGNIIVVDRYSASLVFNSAAYSATAINLSYGNAGGPALAVGLTTTLVGASSSFWQNTRGDVTSVAAAGLVNQPLVLTAASSPTTGNSPIDIDIWYMVSAT